MQSLNTLSVKYNTNVMLYFENPRKLNDIVTKHEDGQNTVVFVYRAGKYIKSKLWPFEIKFHNPAVRQNV